RRRHLLLWPLRAFGVLPITAASHCGTSNSRSSAPGSGSVTLSLGSCNLGTVRPRWRSTCIFHISARPPVANELDLQVFHGFATSSKNCRADHRYDGHHCYPVRHRSNIGT